MSTIKIDEAITLAKFKSQIKVRLHRKNWDGTSKLVSEIVRCRFPTAHVMPLIDEIEHRTGYRARDDYYYNLKFYPPAEAAAPSQADAPDPRPDYDHETGEGCVRYQGIDLETALHGPMVPRDQKEAEALLARGRSARFDPLRVRGFPFAQVFGKLKIADHLTQDWNPKTRKSDPPRFDGIYITPFHEHEPGAQCCYAIDAPDDHTNDGAGTESYALGCEAQEIEQNAYAMFKYLESELITLDEIKLCCYGFHSNESVIPDPPDGIFPDASLGLFVLDGVEPIRVCNYAYPIADVVDEHGKPHGRLLRFWNGSIWREYVVAWRALESEGAAMFQDLSDNGLPVNNMPATRAAFRQIVKAPKLDRVVAQYSRPSWHGHDFVLPTGQLLSAKRPPSQVRVAREAATKDQSQGGTYEAWIKGVANEIWKGDTPAHAMGMLAGMAGVITSLLLIDHPVVHFSGPTRTGKSTAQIIGAGLTANPAPGMGTLVLLQEDVEEVLPKGAGTCGHIDDPSKYGSPTTVERLMYRATTTCPFTVSSVAPLATIVERAGGKMNEGIRSRVLTVDTGKAPKIDPFRAEDIKAAALANYGHAAPWFIDHVLERGGTTARADLLQRVRTYVKALPGDMTDGEVITAGRHIAVLQVVGEMMIGAGLIPAEADVKALLLSIWNDWLESKNASPVTRAIARLDASLSDAEALGSDPDGLCWTKDGVGYIPTGKLEEIIGDEIKAAHVMSHLQDAGRLDALSTKNLAHNRLPAPDGRPIRHYRVHLTA